MAEYARATDGAGNVYQFVDAEICMILDTVTGEPQRFGKHHNATASFEEALEFVKRNIGWETRWAIVRLPAVRGFPVRTTGE
jgi:hypothetical protein